MKKTNTHWQRLVAAARQASDVSMDDKAPYGFSTRVAAVAMTATERPTLQTAINHFAWRALSLSLVLMAVSIAANYATVIKASETAEREVVDLDPVEEALSLS